MADLNAATTFFRIDSVHRLITRLLLAAVALCGVTHLALLPPWEGFDEYAHWSSIQQIADTGTVPFYGRDRVSIDVDGYPGPMPYASAPPFDETGRLTYRSFRDLGHPALPESVDRGFRPGRELNWQAQHPPLYYMVLAPAYHLTKSLSWTRHLLVLRSLSWTFAFAGLALGVLATERWAAAKGSRVAPFMAAYPFLVPQFFPEMARLGNDGLCLLIAGAAWFLLLNILAEKPGVWAAPALGLVLGLGLLTKAFFLPITVGVTAFLALRWLLQRQRVHARHLLLCATVAATVGAAWYLRNLLLFDNLLGTNDFIRLAHGVGLRAGLEQNFSLPAYARGLAAIAGTYIWAGSWSLAQPPEYLLVPPALLILLTLAAWLSGLQRCRFVEKPAQWLPLFLVVPVAGGLAYHLLTAIAETGRGAGTPGWYLHILAAPISFAMATGWERLRSQRFRRAALRFLAVGSIALGLVGHGMQLALFSGCAVKAGTNKYYDLATDACWVDWTQLSELGFPWVGLLSLAFGSSLGMAAALLGLRTPAPRDAVRAA
ncbi:hypothetical protein [Azospirillum sp. TSO35-2]|uniref:hypothetical protein n=1 Tax=Azospirillum sp. TSO35-2 TaxID=716796 RepID=UPI000D65ADE5|nr:hypothetical protein [Azospirillum sp. TSO35-2]